MPTLVCLLALVVLTGRLLALRAKVRPRAPVVPGGPFPRRVAVLRPLRVASGDSLAAGWICPRDRDDA